MKYRRLNTIIGQNILYYPSLPSTMDVAKRLAEKGVGEGTVIVAAEQTAGRGRLGRRWLSPLGSSLSVSIVLRPDLDKLSQLNMAASLATAQSIENATGLKSAIKWPNDVLLNGKKVSGMLIENIIEGGKVKTTIVGIGINLTLDPSAFPEIATTATSLSIESGKKISPWEMLHPLLREFESIYQDLYCGKSVYKRWLTRVETLGKLVRVKSNYMIEEGYAESINTDGNLVLKRSNGSLVTMVAGEVTLHV